MYADHIARDLGLSVHHVHKLITLFEEGASIPFIARYRKELTGGMDEVQIAQASDLYVYLQDLEKRKQYIIQIIEKQEKLTPELKAKVNACFDAVALEDIYLPYKPKRVTRAELAKKKGLTPLAKIIMDMEAEDPVESAACYLGEELSSLDEVLAGARDIVAEWCSEHEGVRSIVRNCFKHTAHVRSKLVKGKEKEAEKFQDYFDWEEPLKRCSTHRFLALRRGEKLGCLRVSIRPDKDNAWERLTRYFDLEHKPKASAKQFALALQDAYKRLLVPSIETEFIRLTSEQAEKEAIDVFGKNVMQLLLAPPLGDKRVLAIDPGYRTGCKTVCLDERGDLLHNETIYALGDQADRKKVFQKLSTLVEAYKIDAIAIGNGTGGRDMSALVQQMVFKPGMQVFSISEDGASIYSASAVAREEFPNYDVTVRGAVSIGRRLMDPLAELVKIDPQSIGVGQYQHDMDETKMKQALDRVVEHCVNKVGVNLNTASKHLLTHVSGLGPQLAENIVAHRKEYGNFKERKELLKVKRMGAKSYEQAAGFLRISGGKNVLDNTSVHPESYKVVEKMAKQLACSVEDLLNQSTVRQKIEPQDYVSESVGRPTIELILEELEKPGRDPRKKIKTLEFDGTIKKVEDLSEGQVLNGIITNITQFGAFVDIGIKENGLIHVSNMADHFVSDPSTIVHLHEHVSVKVIGIDLARKRISLSLEAK